MIRLVVAAFVMGSLSAPAFSQSVDQVERLDSETGESEFGIQSAFVGRTVSTEALQTHVFSFEYGLSDALSIGFELMAEADGDENFAGDALLIQAKATFLGDSNSPFRLGAQASIGPSLAGESGEAELELLTEGSFFDLILAADVNIENELGTNELQIGYGMRSDWRQAWGVLAVEAGGELSKTGGEIRRHWLGPVVEWAVSEFAAVELSYLRGLNSATPDQQVRLQLGFRR
jgi:hypothetical protein